MATAPTLEQLVQAGAPQFRVMFQLGSDGQEQFQWGMTKNAMPVLSAIGALVRAVAELPLLEPGDARHSITEQHFVLAWDAATRATYWFLGPDIPLDPLLGILETIKGLLVDSQLAQRAASNQTRLFGPDGTPWKGK